MPNDIRNLVDSVYHRIRTLLLLNQRYIVVELNVLDSLVHVHYHRIAVELNVLDVIIHFHYHRIASAHSFGYFYFSISLTDIVADDTALYQHSAIAVLAI